MANPDSGGSVTGAVVGGAAGALLGNQVGQGAGRTAATAAGAIGGSMIGDRVMSSPPPQQGQFPQQGQQGQFSQQGQYPQQGQFQAQQAPAGDRCRTVDGATREILRGYAVVYRFNGRDITTTVSYNPGTSIRLGIGAIDPGAQPQAAFPGSLR